MRADWICYLCGIDGTQAHVRKRRVKINAITSECIFLCSDCSPQFNEVVKLLRTRKNPPGV